MRVGVWLRSDLCHFPFAAALAGELIGSALAASRETACITLGDLASGLVTVWTLVLSAVNWHVEIILALASGTTLDVTLHCTLRRNNPSELDLPRFSGQFTYGANPP